MDDIRRELEEWFVGKTFMGPHGLHAYGKYVKLFLPTMILVFKHTRHFGTILQAGGHIGVVTLAMASRFQRVETFECADDNFAWLTENIAPHPHINATYGALGDGEPVQVIRHKYSAEHHARGPGDVPCFRIDDLGLNSLDTMVLDLEGGELVALQHATETLQRFRPVLVIEEFQRWMRRYGRQPGDVANFLEPFGYRVVDEHEPDLVFVVD